MRRRCADARRAYPGRGFRGAAKPRLNLLVVASALAGYAMARRRYRRGRAACFAPSLGTALVAGGASAYNQIIERDADALMRRTRLRPLPDGRLHVERGAGLRDGAVGRWAGDAAAARERPERAGRARDARQLRRRLYAAQAADVVLRRSSARFPARCRR